MGERVPPQPKHKLAEGKTKIIWASEVLNQVVIESKDTITSGDGQRQDIILGKGALSTQTTCNAFELLRRKGVPTHFIERESERSFRAQAVDMIPCELVARRLAYGSFLQRNPGVEPGARFDILGFDIYLKDDVRHDPLLVFDYAAGVVKAYDAHQPISADSLIDIEPLQDSKVGFLPYQWSKLRSITTDTFRILEDAWARQEATLVDLKIECGINEAGHLVVADVIDNDSWRLWPNGDPQHMVDKQLYRDGHDIDTVLTAYAGVAVATELFVGA